MVHGKTPVNEKSEYQTLFIDGPFLDQKDKEVLMDEYIKLLNEAVDALLDGELNSELILPTDSPSRQEPDESWFHHRE